MKFLFLECHYGKHCELYYASCVAEKVAKQIKKKGHEVIEVKTPSPEDANEAIRKHNPDHIWWIGHGARSAVSLEDVNIWIADREHCGQSYGNKNREVLRGVNANALSCHTAYCLGKSLTAHYNTKWYLGYDKPFELIWCGCDPTCACGENNPWGRKGVRDKVTRNAMECMHESNLYYTLGLAKGYDSQEAYWFSLQRFKHWIKYWEKFEPQSDREKSLANLVNRVLRKDMKRQKLVRSGKYMLPKAKYKPKPKPKPRPSPLPAVMVAGAGMGLALIGMAKGG